jgi:hypothetical protein
MSFTLADLQSTEFNELFLDTVNYGGEALEKTSSEIGDYIQMKIREQGFARKILEFGTVTNKDPLMQRSEEHDELEYMVPLEPDSVAQRIGFRADPERTWIQGKRFRIRFFDVSTDEFAKTEQELLAHTEPVLKIIEQNSLKDMQEQEDISFLDHVKAAALAATFRLNQSDRLSGGLMGFQAGEGALVDAWFKGTPTSPPIANPTNSQIIMSPNTYWRRETVAELAQCFSNRQLQLRMILMHEATYADTLRWFADEVGHTVADRITVDGYREAKVGGYTILTTIKTNLRLVRPGHLYGFTDKSALGKFLQLIAPKFWINKRSNVIQMRGWETVAAGIGNVNGCAVMMLAGSEPLTIPVDTRVYGSGWLRLYPEGRERPVGADPDQ